MAIHFEIKPKKGGIPARDRNPRIIKKHKEK